VVTAQMQMHALEYRQEITRFQVSGPGSQVHFLLLPNESIKQVNNTAPDMVKVWGVGEE
jgi:hypothetical protein